MNVKPESIFVALGSTTRFRCMLLLSEFDYLCVCELTTAVGAAQPNISRHLAQLRDCGLVKDRREGLWVYYRINPDLPAWMVKVLREIGAGVKGEPPFAKDIEAVRTMPNRPGGVRCGFAGDEKRDFANDASLAGVDTP